MRNAFAAEINAQAVSDSRVVLLSGDIGNRLFDPIKASAPDRFLNCGVAEANMMTVAAGMAMNGLRPVVYTIAPFVTTRCLEQIRVDVCYHQLPVVIVGVGAGLSYASLGATHHSCEDIALLRSLPNMTVISPADAHEVRGAARAVHGVEAAPEIRCKLVELGVVDAPIAGERHLPERGARGVVGEDAAAHHHPRLAVVGVDGGEAVDRAGLEDQRGGGLGEGERQGEGGQGAFHGVVSFAQ